MGAFPLGFLLQAFAGMPVLAVSGHAAILLAAVAKTLE
jgi:hypothetical protein